MFYAFCRLITALFSGAAEGAEALEKLAESANMAATKLAHDQHLQLCKQLDKSQLDDATKQDLKTRLAPRPVHKSAPAKAD